MSENGQEPTLPVTPEQLDIHDINGRLSELADINAALTARCANMRGQMAKKDAEIQKLTAELVRLRKAEAEHAAKTAMANKRPGERTALNKH